jgi:hypothetical protein
MIDKCRLLKCTTPILARTMSTCLLPATQVSVLPLPNCFSAVIHGLSLKG